MPQPKKKTSVGRKGKRRAGHTHKLYLKTTTACPNCKETILPYAACPACGQYKGKEFIKIKVKEAAPEGEQKTTP